MLVRSQPRLAMAGAIVLFNILTILYYFRDHVRAANRAEHTRPAWPWSPFDATPRPLGQLPAEYDPESDESGVATEPASAPASAFCRDRFGPDYLAGFRNSSIQYCSDTSLSRLTCFHQDVRSDGKADSLCISAGSVLDIDAVDGTPLYLQCDVQAPTPADLDRGAIALGSVQQYWYDTGPAYILHNYVDMMGRKKAEQYMEAVAKQATDGARRFTLLVKREGEANLWHCLMEIWAMAMTMDVLSTTADALDPAGRPYFRVPDDVPNMQVLVLDDRADGPYFDLWQLFSGRAPLRPSQLAGNADAEAFYDGTDQRFVVPLAGAANPVWQNDWAPRDCTDSATLRAFVRRVLHHYRVDTPVPDPDRVRVTVVDRSDANTRKLVNQDALLAALRAQHPEADVDVVSFGTLAFADQLQLVRRTDVLVGLHGAGLAHTMFLRPHATAVVELQPGDMDKAYMGFRNLASMRGVTYLRAIADVAHGRKRDWHTENFFMPEDMFLFAMNAAIQAVSKDVHRQGA